MVQLPYTPLQKNTHKKTTHKMTLQLPTETPKHLKKNSATHFDDTHVRKKSNHCTQPM